MTFSEAHYEAAKTALEECEREYHRIIFVENSTQDQRRRIALERNRRSTEVNASLGWLELNDQTRDELWELMFQKLIHNKEFCFPAPSATWDVRHVIESAPKNLINFDADIIRKCLNILKLPALNSMKWYVIENIQHTWYSLDLERIPSRDVKWPHEVFPCADPFYLVNADMSCGLIAEVGGPVSVFGEPFFGMLSADPPLALAHVADSVRK